MGTERGDVEETVRVMRSYEQTQRRLRAAGERAKAAETMRRAAVAEMAQAIRDHRAVLATAGDTIDRNLWRMDMEQAESHTGLSRRTLSTALADDSARSDAQVAAEYRAYGYDEHHGQAELHRRYPHLAGLHEAGRLLSRHSLQTESEQDLDSLLGFGPEGLEESTQEQLLRQEYRRQVDAIADGSAALHHDGLPAILPATMQE
ncbi:hypothetical protein ACFVV7_26700 [Streptomyces globisporus]|uniref:hypothetical protein n=1 Tax=Streptomyces globisporus TaxID=1908 RepID=UPI0036DB9D4B